MCVPSRKYRKCMGVVILSTLPHCVQGLSDYCMMANGMEVGGCCYAKAGLYNSVIASKVVSHL